MEKVRLQERQSQIFLLGSHAKEQCNFVALLVKKYSCLQGRPVEGT